MQLEDGAGGFLVEDVEGCAERTLWLLRHHEDARALGAAGRAVVRQRFLLTRLMADELRLYASLLTGGPSVAEVAAAIAAPPRTGS
jgi:trehalose synthase